MKLNKYIYSMLVSVDVGTITEEDVEDWIAAWYKDTYARTPPMWLSGKDWAKREKERIERKRGEE